ncbi:hypothetical protein GGS21DRAFT_234213 [Xylaria nigripes]|nr:hypothetical protein GGS21DRAFT_234213 [Xylaria nigripes]
MEPRVSVYTKRPEALADVLTGFGLPYSLPLVRRLRFMAFPGGCTDSTRVLWSSRVSVEEYSASAGAGAGASMGADGDVGAAGIATTPFAAAYLDFSRGPETELWLFSSMEVRVGLSGDVRVQGDSKGAVNGTGRSGRDGDVSDEDEIGCVMALLREIKREQDLYFVPGTERARARQSPSILVGNLNEVLREALVARGVGIVSTGLYDKWMFRVDDLPDIRLPETLLTMEGMRWAWDVLRQKDFALAISRTNIQRTERTLKLLPSMALYLDDETPIAWALLGPDSSLSSLHCEEPYRGRGIAKVVAAKLLKDRIREYGDDGYAWADVAPDNIQSQGVCRSLKGRVKWQISWSLLDLN